MYQSDDAYGVDANRDATDDNDADDNTAGAGDADDDAAAAGENLIVNFSPGGSDHPGYQPQWRSKTFSHLKHHHHRHLLHYHWHDCHFMWFSVGTV